MMFFTERMTNFVVDHVFAVFIERHLRRCRAKEPAVAVDKHFPVAAAGFDTRRFERGTRAVDVLG